MRPSLQAGVSESLSALNSFLVSDVNGQPPDVSLPPADAKIKPHSDNLISVVITVDERDDAAAIEFVQVAKQVDKAGLVRLNTIVETSHDHSTAVQVKWEGELGTWHIQERELVI